MKFEEVIPAMREGKKIINTYMKEKHIVMYMKDEYIYESISTPDYSREYKCPFINAYHFFRDDWEIVEHTEVKELQQ